MVVEIDVVMTRLADATGSTLQKDSLHTVILQPRKSRLIAKIWHMHSSVLTYGQSRKKE